MFHEDAKILAKRGGEARKNAMTPQERSLSAAKASHARWYKMTGEQIDRINSYLRGLALIAAKALAEGDDDKYMRAVSGMGQYERMKLMIEGSRSKDAKPAEEMDDSGAEAVKAFRKGRDETVIDVTEEKKK